LALLSLLNQLKMLVILARCPVTTPLEAGSGKELEAKVIVIDLV
jgi:hypothetical protein